MTRRARKRSDGATLALDKELLDKRVFRGGNFQPLSPAQRDAIVDHAFKILSDVGMADAPDWLAQLLIEKGAHRRSDGRLCFPASVVEAALKRAAKTVALPGFRESDGIQVGGGYVHIGTGGAAVQTLDAASGDYRDSTLRDLYSMMRVLDHCEHIHYGVRPLVARDIESPFELDINTAYTCLSGTGKPIGVSFDCGEHVEPIVNLFDTALQREQGFRKQPFCMAIIVHVVPPLRFAAEGIEIMRKAIAAGMPLQICSAGQAGATSPAPLAGALAQGLAESLAGLLAVDSMEPGFPCIYAFMPFVSDLRTGAMSGGGGEVAVANAAAAQLLRHLELPSTVAAGMTDAKVADAQSGYEKGYTVALAAQAGADMINLSVGMLGSIMVASPEMLLIDNEMCGAILRSVRGVEVDATHLDLETVERVVSGEGHYLGEPQTLDLMKTEYLYPQLGDRQSVHDWQSAGATTIWQRASAKLDEITNVDLPQIISPDADKLIRERFPIRLNFQE
ncbi:MAG: trimethylamine methyltransferase family protein [Pseudomonadota bacterium]